MVSKAGGTLVYAAPEVFSGIVGKAADIYSLGVCVCPSGGGWVCLTEQSHNVCEVSITQQRWVGPPALSCSAQNA